MDALPVLPTLLPARTWCTLVMLDEQYAAGAVAVAISSRNVVSQYPIGCLIDDGISNECEDFLRKHMDWVVRVPVISHATTPLRDKIRDRYHWISSGFTKWQCLNSKYVPGVEKMVFLDADMIFRENIDDIFDMTAPAMTFSSPWQYPYGNRNRRSNPYNVRNHGDIVSPNQMRQGLSTFVGSSNMVLLEPRADMYNEMIRLLDNAPVYGHPRCANGHDEQMFADICVSLGIRARHIHQRYNWYVGKYNWLDRGEVPLTWQWYNDKPWRTSHKAAAMAEYEDIPAWWEVVADAYAKDPYWFELTHVGSGNSGGNDKK